MARNIVGPKVRLARKLSQPPLTQGELSARLQVLGLGIEQSSVSKIEQGLRPVSDVEVMVLSKALKVTVGWLLGEDNTSTLPHSSTNKKSVLELGRLSIP